MITYERFPSDKDFLISNKKRKITAKSYVCKIVDIYNCRTVHILLIIYSIKSNIKGTIFSKNHIPKILAESKVIGTVSSDVYWEYFRSGAGPVLLTAGIVSTIVSQSLFNYSDIWLSKW